MTSHRTAQSCATRPAGKDSPLPLPQQLAREQLRARGRGLAQKTPTRVLPSPPSQGGTGCCPAHVHGCFLTARCAQAHLWVWLLPLAHHLKNRKEDQRKADLGGGGSALQAHGCTLPLLLPEPLTTCTTQICPRLSLRQEQDLTAAEKPLITFIREQIRQSQPGGARPPVPAGIPPLQSRFSPNPGCGAPDTSQKWTFHIKGQPKRLRALWVSSSREQARCKARTRLPAARPSAIRERCRRAAG